MNSYSTATPSITSTENTMNFKKLALYGGSIIILTILGVNIFYYLGNLTEVLSSIFKTILTFFGVGAAIERKTHKQCCENNLKHKQYQSLHFLKVTDQPALLPDLWQFLVKAEQNVQKKASEHQIHRLYVYIYTTIDHPPPPWE